MPALGDLGEDFRVHDLPERGFVFRAVVMHSPGPLLRIDGEGAGDVEFHRFQTRPDGAEKVFAAPLITNEERRHAFEVEVDAHAALIHVRAFEHDRIGFRKARPARQRVELDRHRYAFSMRSCGACASTSS